MIDQKVRSQIIERIEEIESAHQVKILLAIESEVEPGGFLHQIATTTLDLFIEAI